MDLSKIREQIDITDDKIKELYLQRMELVKAVTEAKKQTGKATNDPEREKNILLRITEGQPAEMQIYLKRVYETLFETSKSYQASNIECKSEVAELLKKAVESGEKDFPIGAKVACQGVPGAYSGIAADRLFELADITFFKSFEGVFQAVEKGFCKFGLLPIENSYAGSVYQVYDLMKEHKFHIVKSIRLPISHNLVANSGAKAECIKEIFSHEQAINQCRRFIEKNFPNATVTACANTALAAKMVSESGRTDVAAISSKECAELYNLKVIKGGIQDVSGNYTRFILIAKDFEIYKGAQRISIMTTLSHTPGSLYKLLGKFSNLGINLTKLESRPMIGLEFEFMFYFDFECDVARQDVQNLIAELDCSTEQFAFLGAYNEVI